MEDHSLQLCQCALHVRERELLEQIGKLETELQLLREVARTASEFTECEHDEFGCDASEAFTEALGAYELAYPSEIGIPACAKLYLAGRVPEEGGQS